MVTRRLFLQVTVAGALVARATPPSTAAPLSGGSTPRTAPVAAALSSAALLDASAIPQFQLRLPVPAVMPKVRRRATPRGPVDEYQVSARQTTQQMLPPPFPATAIWAYGPTGDSSARRHTSPAPIIVAEADVPTEVRWTNELSDKGGRPLPHLLPVDPSLHWANPERLPDHMGRRSTDSQPALTGRTYVPADRYTNPATQYTTYGGPVPLVTHLHGAEDVGDESDGYPEAWTLPAGADETRYAPHGTWWAFFAEKARRLHGVVWGAGEQVTVYPNRNRAGLLWYHDHALGMTRLNVYAGLVGPYLVTGGVHGDAAIEDSRTGAAAKLPEQVPIVVQDRAFRADGSLFYPDSRAYFDGFEGPYVPTTPVAPVWNPEFFGNTITVNGAVWPRHDVSRRRYRLRLLNGCDSRFLELDFSSIPGVRAWQIGTEGGTLPAPVDLTGSRGGRLLVAPAERADLIVDFAGVAPGLHVLRNVAPDAPYPGDGTPADPSTTGRLMAFRVIGGASADATTPPQFLQLPAPAVLGPAIPEVRRLALLEHMHSAGGDDDERPTAAMLGIVEGDPGAGPATALPRAWADPLTENPAVGATEVWEIHNLTGDAHPIHLHLVLFEVLNRQDLAVDDEGSFTLAGSPRPPEPHERGRKDTVIVWPGTVVRLKARFPIAGQYVWHCHVLSHEDNEMMRPYRVGPPQPGQPMESGHAH